MGRVPAWCTTSPEHANVLHDDNVILWGHGACVSLPPSHHGITGDQPLACLTQRHTRHLMHCSFRVVPLVARGWDRKRLTAVDVDKVPLQLIQRDTTISS